VATQIVHRDEIERALETVELVSTIESGFVDYSAGKAVVPPVGELLLPGGEVHIKYGYIQGDTDYVVKIASGFPGNRDRGLPGNSGLMLAFDQASGVPTAILLDEGRLTDVRTAVAGAVAARHLAPQRVDRIGIVGTGVQARLQLQHLEGVTTCRDVVVWGRNQERARRYVADMGELGFRVEVAPTVAELAARCELIVTTTAATEPLLRARDLRPGTHISAIGSDTEEKQELAADVLERADVVVADSRAQCTLRGEVARAIEKGAVTMDQVAEIGEVIAGRAKGRTATDQITVFDSTGVAVQDIRIAAAVLRGLGRSG
jgi:ornithine cyclodeaminase